MGVNKHYPPEITAKVLGSSILTKVKQDEGVA